MLFEVAAEADALLVELGGVFERLLHPAGGVQGPLEVAVGRRGCGVAGGGGGGSVARSGCSVALGGCAVGVGGCAVAGGSRGAVAGAVAGVCACVVAVQEEVNDED
jgi:hypothetical protein